MKINSWHQCHFQCHFIPFGQNWSDIDLRTEAIWVLRPKSCQGRGKKKAPGKIIQLGELTDPDFEDTRDDIFDCLNFISEEQIPYQYWQEAIPLVRDTDMDDIAFVVLSEYLDAQLWTGDKKLLKGLTNMGFTKGVTTDEIYSLLQSTEK